MSSKSIVDRVLLFAAAICAAGLVWQLTVLATARQTSSSFHKIETSSPASAPAADSAASTSTITPIRVVYADSTSPKMVGKATDIAGGASGPPPSPASAPSTPLVSLVSTSASAAGVETPDARPAVSAPRVDAPASKTASASDAGPIASEPEAARDTAPAPARVADLPPREAPAASNAGKTPGKPAININHASIEDLNHLSGAGRIGQAIASHRPYASVEDLLRKRVVRRNVYDHIKSQLAAQ